MPKNAEVPPSTTVLGDWYANLHIAGRQQLVVCMNARTLAVVIVPAREGRTLGPRFRIAVENYLHRLGVPAEAIGTEVREMAAISFVPTASRSVLGCLNEAEFVLSRILPEGKSLEEMELILSKFIYSTTGYRQPRSFVLELFAQQVLSTK